MARHFTSASSEFITVGNVSALNVTGTVYSVACWIFMDSHTAIQKQVTRWDNHNGSGQIFAYELAVDTTPKAVFAGGNGSTSVDFALVGGTTLSNSTWYHLLGVKSANGAGGAVLYVNGVSDGTAAPTLSIASNSVINLIGADRNTGNATPQGNYMDGRIYDAAVWNIALTANEALALARGARPYTIRPAGLVGYWPLDGQSSPEPDLSGNANNGTLTGTSAVAGPPATMFTPRWPRNYDVAAAPSTIFRKTASRIGTRTGTRQTWAA